MPSSARRGEAAGLSAGGACITIQVASIHSFPAAGGSWDHATRAYSFQGATVGIRETLNQNPGITTGVTAGIIVLALIFIVISMFSSNRPPRYDNYYFTVDDGATY